MKFKDRIKTYNFWVSLASAIFLIINLIGQKFNFHLDESIFNDLFTALCGILVLLGIIAPPINNTKLNKDSTQSKQTTDTSNDAAYEDETKLTNSEKEKTNMESINDIKSNEVIYVSSELEAEQENQSQNVLSNEETIIVGDEKIFSNEETYFQETNNQSSEAIESQNTETTLQEVVIENQTINQSEENEVNPVFNTKDNNFAEIKLESTFSDKESYRAFLESELSKLNN